MGNLIRATLSVAAVVTSLAACDPGQRGSDASVPVPVPVFTAEPGSLTS